VQVTHVHALSTAPRDSFGIPMLPPSAELSKAQRLTPPPQVRRHARHGGELDGRIPVPRVGGG
jgi:hypothetical protein